MSRQSTYWRVVFLVVFFSTAGFGAIIFSRRPSNPRAWAADQAKLPEIVRTDSQSRAKYRINELARAAVGRPDLSRLIRATR